MLFDGRNPPGAFFTVMLLPQSLIYNFSPISAFLEGAPFSPRGSE